jgi:hypothetical protein
VCLRHDHEPGPHRQGTVTLVQPLKVALNAFEITIDGCLSAACKENHEISYTVHLMTDPGHGMRGREEYPEGRVEFGGDRGAVREDALNVSRDGRRQPSRTAGTAGMEVNCCR